MVWSEPSWVCLPSLLLPTSRSAEKILCLPSKSSCCKFNYCLYQNYVHVQCAVTTVNHSWGVKWCWAQVSKTKPPKSWLKDWPTRRKSLQKWGHPGAGALDKAKHSSRWKPMVGNKSEQPLGQGLRWEMFSNCYIPPHIATWGWAWHLSIGHNTNVAQNWPYVGKLHISAFSSGYRIHNWCNSVQDKATSCPLRYSYVSS